MKKIENRSYIKRTAIEYVINNSKEYILVILIFIIGLMIGVMFVNNCSLEKETSITSYIADFLNRFKEIGNINKTNLVMSSIRNNLVLAIILWISGTTIIGMPIVLAIILFRGFCLGVTVSSITLTIGVGKGILFCFIGMLLQNIFFIPAVLTIGVSSIKLYKSIIKDRRKENIKVEIIRHTIISIIMSILLILASFIENEISILLLQKGIKHIM